MHLSDRILGKQAVRTLEERHKAAVLTIGSDTFTRSQLARVACFNYTAAAHLSNILARLNVKNSKDVYQNINPGALALPGLGVISLATLGAAFEAKGVGNLDEYVNHHLAEGQHVVT